MSILQPEVHAALTQLLQALAAADNTIRSHAEEQLNNEWVAARPDLLLMGLVEQIQQGGEAQVRKYGSVPADLFRRIGLTHDHLGHVIDAVFCSSIVQAHSYED